ncbi:MAG: metallopeptidase family protein [Phycisphaeraceae bacterium]|nr:metallopeptidase family protein [Phycisphaeraceae bacterium]
MTEPWPAISNSERKLFDQLLEQAIDNLPPHVRAMLDELPVIVEDWPSEELLAEMEIDPDEDDLLGVHWGTPLTERSVEAQPDLPDEILIFRGPILDYADGSKKELRQQIRITLLHEIGHHFGLDEDDLDRLGYG